MEHEVVARAESERGEVVVRRRPGRADSLGTDRLGTDSSGTGVHGTDVHGTTASGADEPVLELRVNGVFVMDTTESATERRLARAALEQVARPRSVLVGGLGLGFTLRELLADDRVERVVVAEIEPAIVTWMRDGTLPGLDVITDGRVEVVVGDVRDIVGDGATASYDVVLLDVDNGPDFLVYDDNAAIYGAGFLAGCRRLLTPDGALAVWSSTRSPALEDTLRRVFGCCDAVPVPVDLQGRDERYWLFTSKMSG